MAKNTTCKYTECQQDERVRGLQQRVDKLEERTDNVKSTLDEIKAFQNKLMWTMIGGMGITILNLIVLLLNYKK